MIIAGTTDLATARANRQAIEAASGTLDLPAGVIDVDQAPNFPSGLTVNGHADGSSTIRNTHYAGPTYPYNTSGIVYGEGIDYRNADWQKVGPSQISHPNISNYREGNVIFLWHVTPGSGPTYCWRSRIVLIEGDVATLADVIPTDRPFDGLKLCHGFYAQDYHAGEGYVTCTWLNELTDTSRLFLTTGPTVANECYGRYLDVDRVEGQRIYLKSPLSEDYIHCAVVQTNPRVDISFNAVTFGTPKHPDANSFFSKFTRGITYNDCRATHKFLNVTTSEGIVLRDCRTNLFFNSMCGSRVTGTAHEIAFEEGCFDNTLEHLRVFSPDGLRHGIHANRYAACGRFNISDVEIVNAGKTNGSPLYGFYHDSLIRDLKIYGTQTSAGSYTGGNNLRVENLRSDGRLVFQGTKISLDNVRSPLICLGWQADSSNGVAFQCGKVRIDARPVELWNKYLCEEYP